MSREHDGVRSGKSDCRGAPNAEPTNGFGNLLVRRAHENDGFMRKPCLVQEKKGLVLILESLQVFAPSCFP